MNSRDFDPAKRLARSKTPQYAAASAKESGPKAAFSVKGLRERNGNWHYRIKWQGREYPGDTGLKAVPQNVNAAIAKRESRLQQLRDGEEQKVARLTEFLVKDAIAEFLSWYRGEHRDKPNTYKWGRSALASVEHFFAGRLISSLRPGDIEKFKTWRRENEIKEVSIRHNLHALSLLFKYSRKQSWLNHDPLHEVDVPSAKDSNVMRVLSPVEEVRYLEAAKKRSRDLYDLFTIMIQQGCRPSELMTLRHDAVLLAERKFRVVDGKSLASKRTLRMTDDVYRILSRRAANGSVWVFPSSRKEDGCIVTLQKAHEAVVASTGVVCRIYDFRHTFATRMALRGCPLPLLSLLIGHSDMSILNKYIHPSQADMDRAMQDFGRAANYQDMLVQDDEAKWEKVDREVDRGPLSRHNRADFGLIRPTNVRKSA